jgi:hypothetical protein
MAVQLQAYSAGEPILIQADDLLLPYGTVASSSTTATTTSGALVGEEEEEEEETTPPTSGAAENNIRGKGRSHEGVQSKKSTVSDATLTSSTHSTAPSVTAGEKKKRGRKQTQVIASAADVIMEGTAPQGEGNSTALVLFNSSSSSSSSSQPAPLLSNSLSETSEQLLVRSRRWKPLSKDSVAFKASSSGPSSALDVSAANRDFVAPDDDEKEVNEEEEEETLSASGAAASQKEEDNGEDDEDDNHLKKMKKAKKTSMHTTDEATSKSSHSRKGEEGEGKSASSSSATNELDVSDFLLDPDEASKRKTVWERMHSNYLKEKAEKLGNRTAAANSNAGSSSSQSGIMTEDGSATATTSDQPSSQANPSSSTTKQPASKKSATGKKLQPVVAVQASSKIANSATEGAINLLSTNRLSKKLNYEAMESLNRLFDHKDDKDAIKFVDELPPRILTKKRVRPPRIKTKTPSSSSSSSAMIDVQIAVPVASSSVAITSEHQPVEGNSQQQPFAEPQAEKKKAKRAKMMTTTSQEEQLIAPPLLSKDIQLASAGEGGGKDEDLTNATADAAAAAALEAKRAERLAAKKERQKAKRLLRKAEEAAAKDLAATQLQNSVAVSGEGVESQLSIATQSASSSSSTTMIGINSSLSATMTTIAAAAATASTTLDPSKKPKAVPIRRKVPLSLLPPPSLLSQSQHVAPAMDDEDEDDELVGEPLGASKWGAKSNGDGDGGGGQDDGDY